MAKERKKLIHQRHPWQHCHPQPGDKPEENQDPDRAWLVPPALLSFLGQAVAWPSSPLGYRMAACSIL